MQGREIKFRIWDKDLKKMRVCGTDIHDSIAFDMDNNAVYYNMQNGCGSLADGTGTYDLMRFTGLRDKNGKEIYEGDVWLLQGSDTPRVIVWHRYGWWFQYPGSAVTKPVEWTEDGEVIGNIYENPELLEVGK
ncbi:YopX family protein [Brevibacillus borstelensis]|uniref:YopX family protein n=1 Tax=Brevibacillus borstelensis TaxID=45462 RepID=UPI0030F6BD67